MLRAAGALCCKQRVQPEVACRPWLLTAAGLPWRAYSLCLWPLVQALCKLLWTRSSSRRLPPKQSGCAGGR